MPRPRHQIPYTKWLITIEEPLAKRFEEIIDDQVTGRPMVGAKRKVIESLLRELIEEIENGTAHFDPITGRIIRKETAD